MEGLDLRKAGVSVSKEELEQELGLHLFCILNTN